MSTAVTTASPKGVKEAARKRKRRVAIGTGVGAGVGAGLLLLYLAKNANADEGESDPGPRDGGKRGGRAGFKSLAVGDGDTDGTGDDGTDDTSADGSGDGDSGAGGSGGAGAGSGAGPGGSGSDADEPQRTNPKKPSGKKPGSGKKGKGKSPKRTNPKGPSPKRTNPKGPSPKRTNPKPTTPKGPNPKLRDLDRYYNAEWPDPGKFYQVGGQDSDGLYGIAWRWFYTCLFLAARNAGDLDDEAARAWAKARVGPKGAAQAERADFILCVAWNDINYGSYVVAAKNRRGPHGRGIDLIPQHADNWWRIRKRKRVRRNVELGQPGTTGTPRNAGQGNAKLPLLWLPRLKDGRLWKSDGRKLRVAGTWVDGSSFYFPPPVVMNLGIDDATGSASLSVWGCGAGQGEYG